MARVQSVAEQFKIATQATLKETQAIVVRTARREHNRVMRTDPKPAGFRRFVDGNLGAPEEAVKPNGVIVYQYSRLDIVVQFAMETLFERSPVESGAYRMGHTIFLNGAAVANLQGYRRGDEVVIANFLPYARKIELGRMTMTVPGTDHVYAQAEQTVRRRWGNVARIDFTFRGVIAGGLTAGRAGNRPDTRYPALVIAER